MSIKRWFNKIVEYYDGLSIIRKIFAVYLICGALPMLILSAYYYYSTSNLLLKQAYQDIRQSVGNIDNGMDTLLQPYQSILENWKNDKGINIRLNTNYASLSYSDLAYYMENSVEPVMSTHAYMTGIHFYTDNNTLPEDEYYFYPLDELDQTVIDKLHDSGENVILTTKMTDEKSSQVLLLSEMNYYATDSESAYVEMDLSDDVLGNQYLAIDEYTNIYFLDEAGDVVYASSDPEIQKDNPALIRSLNQLETEEVCTVSDGNKKLICMSSEMSLGMKVVMTVEKRSVTKAAMMAPLRMLLVFLIITLLLSGILVNQNQNFDRRLKRILGSLDAIGSGDFTKRIDSKDKDELGEISRAVDEMTVQIDSLIRENYEKQLEVKSSELNLLQEQINPHFLYNALAVISSLSIREHGKETVQSIRYLADFYRISLNKGRKVIHISEEFNLLESYMKIQTLRFSDYVEIFYDMDPAVKDYYTIKLLLQPLVENAIHHAREEELFLTIRVTAKQEGDRVYYDVEDNGMGIGPEKLKELRESLLRQEEGFGLKNVDKRIKLAYGQDYGVTIFSTEGKGTRIHLEIPVKTEYGA